MIRSVGTFSVCSSQRISIVASRYYAKPKAAGKGGKKGKPVKEIAKESYRGPLEFPWWNKAEPYKDSPIHRVNDNSVADISKELANRIQKGRNKLSRDLFSKYVTEDLAKYMKKPAIEIDEDFEFFYNPEAVYDIHAEPRMIGGKYGCRELRKKNYIPAIITGKGYPDFAVQISKVAIKSFTETDQDDRLEDGKKFNLVIEGRRYLVTPRDMILDPVTLDPKFIQWLRLCDPVVKEKIRRAPRPHTRIGPKKHFPWVEHPHMSFERKTKVWMTPERKEERKKRRDMHIHDYLGLPR